MDRIMIILKKRGPRASSAALLGLFSVIFKHIYWYIQQISGEPLLRTIVLAFKLLFALTENLFLFSLIFIVNLL